MSHRTIISCIMWITIFGAIVLAGCSQEQEAIQNLAELRGGDSAILRDGFRIRRDEARNRTWVLGLDDVRVHDSASGRLIQKIELPSWSVARFTCDPDMVLDSSGSAIISSNAQSRLWRIDAASLKVSEYEIRLQGREQWDAGFGALAFAADGNLLALMSFGGSLWDIDLASGTGRRVAPNRTFFNACGSTMQYRRNASESGTVTGLVPAAGNDYTVGAAKTPTIPATGGPKLALKGGRNP